MFPARTIIFDLEYGEREIALSRHGMPSILEIGCVRVTPEGEVAGKYESLVRPLHWEDFTPRIQSLTGIAEEELHIAPTWQEVYPEVIEFCRRDILASWGAIDPILLRYQCGFIGQHWRLSNKYLDMCTMAQMISILEYTPYGLGELCKRLHISQPKHRALEDCKTQLHVLSELFKMHTELEEDEEEDDEPFEIYEF